MDFLEFNAGIDDNDRRIDKVLRNFIKDVPLSSIYKYIRKNLIKINNKKTTQDYRVKTGDVISIAAFIINDFSENQSELKNNLQKNEEKTFQKDLESSNFLRDEKLLARVGFVMKMVIGVAGRLADLQSNLLYCRI